MRMVCITIGICMLAGLSGCGGGPKSAKGFTLPDGDIERGQAAFVSLKCTDCHRVAGIDLSVAEEEQGMSVRLGGEVSRIKTYGELVTSIINPSHRLPKGFNEEEIAVDGESKMRNYNDVMTVSQLIDVVAFLQSRYELIEYEPTDYPPFLFDDKVVATK